MVTIAMISPGAMGSALGRGYAEAGARVVASVEGRSARTRELAHGLELLPSLRDVVAAANVVISVVPPGQALELARQIHVVAHEVGVQPLVADFNAVSPSTVARIAEALDPLPLVDGSISGGPPDVVGTRLYLSGPRADEIAELAHPRLDAHLVGSEIGSASAVKMSTASVYKGLSALMLQALASAEVAGVLDVVLDDLAREFPELIADAAPWLASSASKAHRYVAEMREISLTQEAAGLTPELFRGVGDVWARVAETPLGQLTPEQARTLVDLTEVIRSLELPLV
jgi:3-hydroxyisobutyrate dehydrogenase-like beta-hydroxyacid dehydrogenase